MDTIFQIIIAVVTSVFASSGLWAFILRRQEKKDARTKMLVGLAHDRILYLGTKYIEQGCITNEQYENLHTWLYQPYLDMGGNGVVKKIMAEVEKLPINNITR